MARILIVDDRPSNRQFLTTLLGYGGHQLVEAADGAQALELVRSGHPDLVITDILMPAMDGYEFVQRVRADPEVASTPVIFYTASYSTPQAEALAKSCGVQKVLSKPSEPQVVLDAVNHALGPRSAATPLATAEARVRPSTAMQPLDDSMTLYLKDLQEVRERFEDVVKRSTKLRTERDSIKELSKKFAENVASMQRITTRLSALLEVGMEMTTERDPARLVEVFFAAACDLIDSDYAAVGLLDKSEHVVRFVFAKGIDVALLHGDAARSGLFGSLIAGQRVLRIRGAKGAADGLPSGHPKVRDLLGIPVASADRVYGWIYFANSRDAAGFGEEDARVATMMTRKLALLYENATLYDEIQRHDVELQLEIGERRRAEAARAESEARLRTIFEAAAVGLVHSDLEGRILLVNPKFAEITGYARDEVTALSLRELTHPADLQASLQSRAQLVAGTTGQYERETRLIRKGGQEVWTSITTSPILTDEGRPSRFISIIRDISEKLAKEQALRDSEAGLRRAQVMAKLGHVITGAEGAFVTWSDTLPELVGLQPDRFPRTTRDWLELLHPADRPVFREAAIEAGKSHARTKIKYRLLRADGAWIHVRQTMDPLRGERDIEPRWFNTIQDVTEQREAEEKIERLNRVYAVLSGINAAIVRIRDRQELFQEACRIAVEGGGFRMAWVGLVDREAGVVKPIASAGDVRDFFDVAPLTVIENKPGGHGLAGRAVREMKPMISNDAQNDPQRLMKKELAERGINSVAIVPLIVGREAIGILALYAAEVGVFDDEEMRLLLELAGDVAFALEHIDKAEKVDYLSYYDSLTGLANRTLFHERLEQSILNAAQERRSLGLALFDIERFKSINDSLGRQAGDAILKQIAERMTHSAVSVTRAARTGADQFAKLVPDKQANEFARLIEKQLDEIFGEPFRVDDHELRIAARVGIAIYPADGTDADTLFRNAEAALKKSKGTGERYMFYEQAMTARVAEKLTLENKLRRALENDEFLLHYQPKVELDARAIVGVEALIRWQSPELGLVPPLKFIPLMEETGLILQVGAWALKRAALDHKAWVEAGLKAPRVAVNVSPIQLRQRDFVKVLQQAIAEGASPAGIDLEITESLIMEDIGSNIEKLKEVRRLGMNIAIDDFGTGYSSLGYLAKLPVQFLKIDRSFIDTMQLDPNAMTLVSTIISLAHSLRLKVIAEGVETEEQAGFLRLLRCDEMQGYLISKPVPAEQLVALLKAG